MTEIMLYNYKKFIENFSEDEIDVQGSDYTSCWLFTYYIHCRFGMPTENYDCSYDYKIDINELSLNTNGIYSFLITNTFEFHHFILYVHNERVLLYSTHGGQEGIIRKKYNKDTFLNRLLKIYNGAGRKEYCNLFGIRSIPHGRFVFEEQDRKILYCFTSNDIPI